MDIWKFVGQYETENALGIKIFKKNHLFILYESNKEES